MFRGERRCGGGGRPLIVREGEARVKVLRMYCFFVERELVGVGWLGGRRGRRGVRRGEAARR